jgi:hypothetical protein
VTRANAAPKAGPALNATPLVSPPLIAGALVLGLAAHNPGQFRASDLVGIFLSLCLAVLLVELVVLAGVRALDGPDRAVLLTAALTAVAVGVCFYYTPLRNALSSLAPALARQRILAPVVGLGALLAAAWVLRLSRDRLQTLSGFLVRLALVLVALLAAQVLVANARGPRAVARSTLVDSLSRPIRTVGPPPSGRNRPPRDIYLIVLDGHANARVLADLFQFNAAPFEDSLRALGFVVPPEVRSNYVQTYLSVSSLLNAAHVTRLTKDAGARSTDHTLPTYLVKHNRVARFLKSHGYKYVLFPSAWWAPTKDSPLADVVFEADTGSSLADIIRRTELRRAVLAATLVHLVLKPEREPLPMVQHIVRTFDGVRDVPADPAPTFTFVHILLPHAPYLLDAQCQPLAQPITDDMQEDTPEQRADYVGQVRCVDGLLLGAVTAIVQRSSTPPVILVVGDHGSGFSDLGFYGHPESVPPAFIHERFGAFGAFRLPAGGDSLFREPITLVNVMSKVLRYYFAADLPPSADSLYVSGQELFNFYPVKMGVTR